MNIPSCINRVPGAETVPARIARPITAGRETDRKGILILPGRLASFRELHRRGRGVVG